MALNSDFQVQQYSSGLKHCFTKMNIVLIFLCLVSNGFGFVPSDNADVVYSFNQIPDCKKWDINCIRNNPEKYIYKSLIHKFYQRMFRNILNSKSVQEYNKIQRNNLTALKVMQTILNHQPVTKFRNDLDMEQKLNYPNIYNYYELERLKKDFLGSRGKKMNEENGVLDEERQIDKMLQNRDKKEFLGSRGRRFDEFLGSRGKKWDEAIDMNVYLNNKPYKKEFLGSRGKKENDNKEFDCNRRFNLDLFNDYNSYKNKKEFLGSRGKKHKKENVRENEFKNHDKKEFLGSRGRRSRYDLNKDKKDFLGSRGRRTFDKDETNRNMLSSKSGFFDTEYFLNKGDENDNVNDNSGPDAIYNLLKYNYFRKIENGIYKNGITNGVTLRNENNIKLNKENREPVGNYEKKMENTEVDFFGHRGKKSNFENDDFFGARGKRSTKYFYGNKIEKKLKNIMGVKKRSRHLKLSNNKQNKDLVNIEKRNKRSAMDVSQIEINVETQNESQKQNVLSTLPSYENEILYDVYNNEINTLANESDEFKSKITNKQNGQKITMYDDANAKLGILEEGKYSIPENVNEKTKKGNDNIISNGTPLFWRNRGQRRKLYQLKEPLVLLRQNKDQLKLYEPANEIVFFKLEKSMK